MSGPDRTVTPGTVWRHHRGTHYFVVAVAQHTETQEQFVIYRRTDASEFWAQPLTQFLSSVVGDPGAKRFVRVR